MKIIIYGAGAVGSVVAALLSKDNDVTLIGREEHVGKINGQGLKLKGVLTGTFHFEAKTKLGSIDEESLVIVTTKAYDLENALLEIKKLLKQDTIVMCLQNGYGIKEIASGIIDNNELIVGTTGLASTFLEPGAVEYFGGNTRLERTKSAEKICELLNNAGIKSKVSDKITEDVWKKLIINCVLNPLTAILGVRNNEIADAELHEIKKNIIKECLLMAGKEGVNIDMDVGFLDSFILESDNVSSMLQDLMKGKKTEIDFMNGAIVKLAEKHKIEVPVNKSVVSMVKFLENGQNS